MTMLLPVLLFIIAQQAPAQSVLDTAKCDFKKEIQILFCAKKHYQPEDVIGEARNRPISVTFTELTDQVELTMRKDYSQLNLAEYKSFSIIDSCVVRIEENYFTNLDNRKSQLKAITFSKVRCLRSLETKSFNEIGRTVQKLYFQVMPDLDSIEADFFDSFTALRKLTISSTNISRIPDDIFTKVPHIEMLNINNNRLTRFPSIPSDKTAMLSNVEGSGNPFHCDCPLMELVRKLPLLKPSKEYRCETPAHLSRMRLQDVGDLCSTTTEGTKTSKTLVNVSLGQFNVQIIIGIAVSLVVIVIIIVAVLVLKNKKKSKEKVVYMDRSPSKIVWQNGDYHEPFLQNGGQMV